MRKKRNIYRIITIAGAIIGEAVILLTTYFDNNDFFWTYWYPPLRVVGITGLVLMIVGLFATAKAQDKIDEGLEKMFLHSMWHSAPTTK